MKVKDQRVTVRFTADLRQKLLKTAARRGSRESDVIREAVIRELDAEDSALTAYERAEAAGLIGVVKNAPRDLSMNRRHFEGFGESRT